MGIDKKEFLNDFKEETKEYLAKLNTNLLILDKNPEQLDNLQKMKKDIHTLKGAARMLGFKEVAEIAHSIEFIFEAVNNKNIVINPLVVNTLFAGFDLLQTLIDKLVKGENPKLEFAVICEGLNKISKKEQGMDSFPGELKVIIEKMKAGKEEIESKGENDLSCGASISEVMPDAHETIKIKSIKIDELLGLSGEIVVAKIKSGELLRKLRTIRRDIKNYNRIVKLFSSEINSLLPDKNTNLKTNNLIKEIQGIENQTRGYYKEYETMTNHMNLIIDKMQEEILSLRMLPLNTIFEVFPRAVRDIAQQYNKKISLEIKGGKVELDKKMLEIIKEPLIHIIRNSIGHGIETEKDRKKLGKPEEGKIIITAWQEGNHVLITVEDDGKGIDPELVKETAIKKKIVTLEEANELSVREVIYLIFRPGFSTSAEVNELSGRGVGTEIVKEKVEELKGEVNIDSEVDKGTKFIIKLPLTLSITSAILVKAASICFAIPTANIDEIVKIKYEDIKYIEERPVINLERRIVPLVDLKAVLGLHAEETGLKKEKLFIVIISYGRQRKGFIVEEVFSEGEVVVKNLGDYIGNIKNIAGATILVNGDIVLLLNVPDLMRAPFSEARVFDVDIKKKEKKKIPEQKSILIVEDSLTTREMERSILETIGYKTLVAGNGVEALEILALKKVDLIITDVQMPVMNGWEFAGKVRQDKKYKDLPLIMVTSLDHPEDKKKGIEMGANAYILKSEFEQDKLLRLIETFI